MPNIPARQTVMLLCVGFFLVGSSQVLADEIEVKIRAHVKLERLHPDVETVQLWCDYFDKQGKSLNSQVRGRCSEFSETTVGADRKVDGAMSWCVKFDESWALKQSWSKYKCNVFMRHKDGGNAEAPRPDHSKKWARVQPGAVLYSEGDFKMD